MKRIAALSLALALTLGLTACGGGNAGTAETPAANSTTPAAETTAPQAEPVEVVVFAAASPSRWRWWCSPPRPWRPP